MSRHQFWALACGLLLSFQALSQTSQQVFENALTQFNTDRGNDQAREKMIAAGRDAKAPIPESARRSLARGAAAFKSGDFAEAVIEFGNAREAASWWDAVYYNLALTFERLGATARTGEDKEHYLKQTSKYIRWYLLAAPNAPDAEAMRGKMYELEYMAERKGKENAEQRKKEYWVTAIVNQLNAFYGTGKIVKASDCEGPNSRNIQLPYGAYIPRCNEADAKGSFWQADPPQWRSPMSAIKFVQSPTDPSKIELRVNSYASLGNSYTAQPTGPNPDTDIPSWSCSSDMKNQLCSGPVRIEFGSSKDGAPWLGITGACDADNCIRRSLVLMK